MKDYNELVRCGECKFWSETEKGIGGCLKSGFQTPKDFLGEDGERKDQGMTDYSELVKALRCKRDDCEGCGLAFFDKDEGWMCQYAAKDDDAADAIEALQAELPKRGEWIKHPEVKNIYGGECIECPFCGEKYVVQYIADEKFCRNCGADMRAKIEVQG